MNLLNRDIDHNKGIYHDKTRLSDYWNRSLFNNETPVRSAEIKKFCKEGWQALLRSKNSKGSIERVRLSDGIEISLINCVLDKSEIREYEADEGFLILYAALGSEQTIISKSGQSIDLNGPELCLINIPSGSEIKATQFAQVRQQRLLGIFRSHNILDFLGLSEGELPSRLIGAINNDSEISKLVSLPINPYVSQLLSNTFETKLRGEFKALQLKARLTELLAVTLEGMLSDSKAGECEIKNMRDLQLAKNAKEILEEEYRKPPDFTNLAHSLGTNPNKLRVAFKTAFGVTMTEYCKDRRMRKAQQLLLEPEYSISQVAEMVGYEYSSGFAVAFLAHAGMTPRDYRKFRTNLCID